MIQGIRFHGLTIPDCQKVLPPAPGGKEMTAESMLWLLLTGQVPTPKQSRQLSAELAEKGELPAYASQLIDSYVHPMPFHPMPSTVLLLNSAMQPTEDTPPHDPIRHGCCSLES